MVFYYTLKSAPHFVCYMGRDKYENEDLIKYGWEEDVWFHVDDHSSAHVYLRLQEGMTWDDIPPATLEELAQLTKNNSIEGHKLNNVNIIYTPWSNLHKRADMDVGTIGYHNTKLVRTIKVETRKPEIINPLEKTKREVTDVNFKALKAQREQELRAKERSKLQAAKEAELKKKEEEKKQAEIKSYSTLMKKVDQERVVNEDDFM
eukprot:PhF_6_TR31994/c0_g1_i1/m.47465